jgi:hypothetical protein
LPLDFVTGTVEILFAPNGQVIDDPRNTNIRPSNRALPFYHIWLASRSDVFPAPVDPNNGNPIPLIDPSNAPFLPTPYTSPNTLKGERRLVSLFTKTGLITINSIEDFTTVDTPFLDAQAGVREP